MKQFYTLLLALCLTTLCYHSQAQTATSYGLQISDIEMTRSDNRLDVEFTILIDGVKIRSNQAISITPFVTNGYEMMQLPAVVIDGRRRHIMHERNKYDMVASTNTYIRHRKREAQEVDYQTDVPFESWMANSELILREECISCFDMPLAEALVPVAMFRESDTTNSDTKAAATTPADKPQLAYITPHSTPSNTLEQSEILFPVNKCTINPAFMNNAAHIEQMQSILKQGGNIKEIHLMGYASPEGPYPFNEALAAKRAEAVKQHLKGCNLPADVKISTNSSPADWAAVRQKLSESFIENYLKIIAIIDDPAIALADKNKVIKEKYPVEYDFMLRVWYPQMRKTDITFAGEKKMTIDEAKAKLQQDPSKLSLEDIYMIALTYEKGSKEWEDIIIIAVDTYPQSPEARINAANVAMANGDFKQAAAYLDGVPSNIPQAMNSRGILAMEEGRYQDAMQLFQAAEQAGVGEATQNIALLKQLVAAENQ